MSNDIEVTEKELINALKFYNITSSNINQARDITWLTKENAKYFLNPEKREDGNRYFAVIKSNQHKLDLVKPFIKNGTSGLGHEIKVDDKPKPKASTSKVTDDDYELYDALVFFDISIHNIEKARDIVWLKREFAKTTLSRTDKELGKHSYEVIKANQAKLKTFKRKFVLIDSEMNEHIAKEFDIPDYEAPDDLSDFRKKVREGIIKNAQKDGSKIEDTIEDIMSGKKTYGSKSESQRVPFRPAARKSSNTGWAILGVVAVVLFFFWIIGSIISGFDDYDDDWD